MPIHYGNLPQDVPFRRLIQLPLLKFTLISIGASQNILGFYFIEVGKKLKRRNTKTHQFFQFVLLKFLMVRPLLSRPCMMQTPLLSNILIRISHPSSLKINQEWIDTYHLTQAIAITLTYFLLNSL